MSTRFAQFLDEQDIDWAALGPRERRELVAVVSGLECKDPSLAVQSAKEECDVLRIIARFKQAGLPLPSGPARFVDVSEVGDYQTAVSRVREADESFMRLPAKVRERFGNDAGKFLDFVSNPANLEEGRSIGLYAPAPKPEAPGGTQA